MLLGAFLGDQGFQRAPKELLVAIGSGADDIDEQVSPGHGGDKAGVAEACGEAIEAFRVAAGGCCCACLWRVKAGEDRQIWRSETSSCKNKRGSAEMPHSKPNVMHSDGEVAPLCIH